MESLTNRADLQSDRSASFTVTAPNRACVILRTRNATAWVATATKLVHRPHSSEERECGNSLTTELTSSCEFPSTTVHVKAVQHQVPNEATVCEPFSLCGKFKRVAAVVENPLHCRMLHVFQANSGHKFGPIVPAGSFVELNVQVTKCHLCLDPLSLRCMSSVQRSMTQSESHKRMQLRLQPYLEVLLQRRRSRSLTPLVRVGAVAIDVQFTEFSVGWKQLNAPQITATSELGGQRVPAFAKWTMSSLGASLRADAVCTRGNIHVAHCECVCGVNTGTHDCLVSATLKVLPLRPDADQTADSEPNAIEVAFQTCAEGAKYPVQFVTNVGALGIRLHTEAPMVLLAIATEFFRNNATVSSERVANGDGRHSSIHFDGEVSLNASAVGFELLARHNDPDHPATDSVVAELHIVQVSGIVRHLHSPDSRREIVASIDFDEICVQDPRTKSQRSDAQHFCFRVQSSGTAQVTPVLIRNDVAGDGSAVLHVVSVVETVECRYLHGFAVQVVNYCEEAMHKFDEVWADNLESTISYERAVQSPQLLVQLKV